MGNRFLRRLFGGQAPAPELVEALGELDRLAGTRPALAASAAVLRDVLAALFAEPAEEVQVSLTEESARAKLAGGLPLLRGETLTPDPDRFRKRWRAVCRTVEGQAGGEPAAALAAAVRKGRLDPVTLLGDVLAGRPEEVGARADALGLDPVLATTVLRLTAFPVLARVGAALDGWRSESAWKHGNCPTCGTWPLLGESRGLEQGRVLRCGLCATAWEFPRLRCPFCGTNDHHLLGFFHAEEEQGRYRAATCDGCCGYLKIASTLSALSSPLLLVTDLATLHLDLIAADRGFFVP